MSLVHEFKGQGWHEGTVLHLDPPKFHVYFDSDGEKVWVDRRLNKWRLGT